MPDATMPTDRNRLITLLKERSVRWGSFTLASGKKSDLYVDARQTTLSAEGAALLGRMIHGQLAEGVVAVGGPVTGADPIAGAVAAHSWSTDRPINAFMVRKEAKGHGAQNWLEGRAGLPDGARVCMLEDTVTTGGSLLRAIERVEEAGYTVAQCIVVVDRQEGAAERLASAGHTMTTLTTREDLL